MLIVLIPNPTCFKIQCQTITYFTVKPGEKTETRGRESCLGGSIVGATVTKVLIVSIPSVYSVIWFDKDVKAERNGARLTLSLSKTVAHLLISDRQNQDKLLFFCARGRQILLEPGSVEAQKNVGKRPCFSLKCLFWLPQAKLEASNKTSSGFRCSLEL